MVTIQAKVNRRLLGKASRLFTGTLSGRIIELLQNARGAKAKHVQIVNRDGIVIVRDDGHGIADFAKLLDLGGSGWAQDLEQVEDPAGVGLFCLAPRPLTVRSNGHVVTITEQGWTGAPVEVLPDPRKLPATESGMPMGAGTELSFADEPWSAELVKPLAVFTGLEVTVDGERCPSEPFLPRAGSHYPELGCRIKVLKDSELTHWHRAAPEHRGYGNNVLVNFHGQVIQFACRPVSSHDLNYLVDLTGEPTGLRLMLPARTQLIENDALAQQQAALEIEAFKYLQRQGHHQLPYTQYLRARELGIDLPEAQPRFEVGLLSSDMSPEPVEVKMPADLPLARCYRLAEELESNLTDDANVHLLAALGRFTDPFVPVEIRHEYDGYSWTQLATIQRVTVTAGKNLAASLIGDGRVICVQSLTITAHCSDGKSFTSAVPLAVKPPDEKAADPWTEEEIYVTPAACATLSDAEIWFHLGGFNDDGDTYETQLDEITEQFDLFWRELSGPHEVLRCKLLDCAAELNKGWRSVTIQSDGRMVIQHRDGREESVLPPQVPAAAGEA